MFKSLRTLAFATLLPFALPTLAQVNATLPANVQKALQTNKLTGNDLSLVLIPLDGPGNPTYYNADVSVNPASTMKLFTTYAALEMLGPTYQWKTEFYTDGQLKNGVLNGNLYQPVEIRRDDYAHCFWQQRSRSFTSRLGRQSMEIARFGVLQAH
ncbi:D-alanyl-D-alanine carboxypeptidase, partial [Pseudomonas aeruginosa]|uniref:D-alanyl-D-alanine carboxypeptidase n=1 Tax=Pseudomonas aeruginosa TaxID=287 RepID=UPI001D0AA6A2